MQRYNIDLEITNQLTISRIPGEILSRLCKLGLKLKVGAARKAD